MKLTKKPFLVDFWYLVYNGGLYAPDILRLMQAIGPTN